MLTERLNTRNYSLFEKLKSVDYFLILIIILIGAISVFAIYSTERGEFSFYTNRNGFKAFDDVPDLPVTEIARSEVELSVEEQIFDVRQPSAGDWVRFNDYGIGLLLQDDTQGAASAFSRVAELVPERLDGQRNLARTALRDGNLEQAYEHLEACEEIKKGDAQTAWVLSLIHI